MVVCVVWSVDFVQPAKRLNEIFCLDDALHVSVVNDVVGGTDDADLPRHLGHTLHFFDIPLAVKAHGEGLGVHTSEGGEPTQQSGVENRLGPLGLITKVHLKQQIANLPV